MTISFMPIPSAHIPNVVEMITRAGFEPRQVFAKSDPRGSEYGDFVASINQAEAVVEVELVRDGDRLYSIQMHPTEFPAWAREHT